MVSQSLKRPVKRDLESINGLLGRDSVDLPCYHTQAAGQVAEAHYGSTIESENHCTVGGDIPEVIWRRAQDDRRSSIEDVEPDEVRPVGESNCGQYLCSVRSVDDIPCIENDWPTEVIKRLIQPSDQVLPRLGRCHQGQLLDI